MSIISASKTVKSFEFLPEKSPTIEDINRAKNIMDGVANHVMIPENPQGKPGIDPIITAIELSKNTSLSAIPHITPRDKNSLYLSSQFQTGVKFGIRDFFIIGGDKINESMNSREVRELDVFKTMELAKKTLEENLKDKNFSIGGAFNPYRSNETEIIKMKISSGANFFVSQIIFGFHDSFIKLKEKKIIAGFMPLKSKSQLNFIKKLGVEIDEETIRRLENTEDIRSESARLILETYEKLKQYVIGIHIMPMNDYEIAKNILECV
ncbi:methylenetetrahydrofolate reductase [Caldiplasma sukawensis]